MSVSRSATIVAVRHAAVAVEGLCYGRLDVPTRLSAPEAAAVVLPALHRSGESFHAVWSSGTARCRVLAEHLAEALGLPARQSDALAEINYGRWEGLPWKEIEVREPDHLRDWMARWRAHGPPGGESARAVEARVRSWCADLPGEAVLLVAHAGVIRALDVIVRGRSWAEAMSRNIPHLQPDVFAPIAPPAP